jgi:hypothetical protein
MYEETHYCLFDMTARRLRAVRHNRSVPALDAVRKAACGVRLGEMAFRFCEPGLCATSTFPDISQNVSELKCVTPKIMRMLSLFYSQTGNLLPLFQ